jgi:hypothetical protein
MHHQIEQPPDLGAKFSLLRSGIGFAHGFAPSCISGRQLGQSIDPFKNADRWRICGSSP